MVKGSSRAMKQQDLGEDAVTNAVDKQSNIEVGTFGHI
jgi:hypothetical protein